MLFFIPENLIIPHWTLKISPSEFITIITISCLIFTLIVKAGTLKKLIKKSGLSSLSRREEFSFHQLKEMSDKNIIRRLQKLKTNSHASAKSIYDLINQFKTDDIKECEIIKNFHLDKEEFRSLLKRYAL